MQNTDPHPVIQSSPMLIEDNLHAVFTYHRDEGRMLCYWLPAVPAVPLEDERLERYETALGLFMQHCADTLDEPVVVSDGDLMRIASPSDDYEVLH